MWLESTLLLRISLFLSFLYAEIECYSPSCHLPRNKLRTSYFSGVVNPCVSSASVAMILAVGLCLASTLSVLASVIEITFFQCSIGIALSLHSARSYDHWGSLLFISVREPCLKYKQMEMSGIVKKIRNYRD